MTEPACAKGDMLAVACQKAIAPFRRRGLSKQLQRVLTLEDLLSAGMLALIEAGVSEEGLAVKVARGAMAKVIRRERLRMRGMVEVREGHAAEAGGEDVSDTDQWDAVIHGKQNLRPANAHPDLWEAVKALPVREYQVIALSFWGGNTQAEIAIEMGVNQATVSRILESAKKSLKSCINGNPRGITTVRGSFR